jgi:hypothetical protein
MTADNGTTNSSTQQAGTNGYRGGKYCIWFEDENCLYPNGCAYQKGALRLVRLQYQDAVDFAEASAVPQFWLLVSTIGMADDNWRLMSRSMRRSI